jgi:hypothetical protein
VPRASARSRESIALTCEVGGDPVRTTVSRPVVMTVTMDRDLTTRGHRRNATAQVTTHVSAWLGRGEGPRASGVSPISIPGFGRGEGPPASGVSPVPKEGLGCFRRPGRFRIHTHGFLCALCVLCGETVLHVGYAAITITVVNLLLRFLQFGRFSVVRSADQTSRSSRQR